MLKQALSITRFRNFYKSKGCFTGIDRAYFLEMSGQKGLKLMSLQSLQIITLFFQYI